MGFVCVAALGVLPLVIVQYAERRLSLNDIIRPRRAAAWRISVFVLLINWFRQLIP